MQNTKSFVKSLFLIFIILILLGIAWYINGGSFYVDRQSGDIQITQGVKHAIPLEDIVDRGASKDSIPAIDGPKFESVTEADKNLDDSDQVVGVIVGEIARAYPMQYLRWHEIVNDKIGDLPISITFSPLTGSTNVFIRKVNKQSISFGVSGKFYNNNNLLYDRSSQSLWTQLNGSSVVGEMTGVTLDRVQNFIFTWKKWKTNYPDTKIMSGDTSYFRSYNIDPYYEYSQVESVYFPVTYEDKRIFAKKLVYGIGDSGKYQAYTEENLKKQGVVNGEVGDLKYILIWDANLGVLRAYNRVLEDGKELEIEKKDDKYYDNESAEWGLDGNGLSDKNSGLILQTLYPTRTYWFSWVAFYSNTEIFI
ncbi:DUF3179 domain-containing protein [Patescibacteria group bacterium]